eukprot:gene12733-12863_t
MQPVTAHGKRQHKAPWIARCCVVGKDDVKHAEDAACSTKNSTANLYVTATGTPPSSPDDSPPRSPVRSSSLTRSSSQDSCIWHECSEEWEADSALADDSSQGGLAQEETLPADLARIIAKYIQGQSMGCKPTLALYQYMERTSTDIQQLQQLLRPVLESEDVALDVPTPTPVMTPLARTRALLHAAHMLADDVDSGSPPDVQPDSSSSSAHAPSVARLLENISVVDETLHGMHTEEGFKQVAWGQLELWYKHDSVAHSQVIKAITILEEPVANVLCLAREVDLVTSWNPAIADMQELGSYSPAELLIYLLMWVPWPLPSPEVVNYAVGVDMLDTRHECVLIATKHHNKLPDGVKLPQHGRTMRLNMEAGGFKFKPLPPHPDRPGVARTEATVLVAIDSAKWVVPDAVISFVLKVFSPLVYKSVLKVLKRMFHPTLNGDAGRHHHGADAANLCHSGRSDSSFSGEGDTALRARLAARPLYAGIASHVEQHLATAMAGERGSKSL